VERTEQRINELFLVNGVGGDDEVKGWSKGVCCFCFCFCFFACECEVPLRRELGPVECRSSNGACIGWEGVLIECDVRLEEMG
jgi:hypothetical protein